MKLSVGGTLKTLTFWNGGYHIGATLVPVARICYPLLDGARTRAPQSPTS